jgi:hypothetical protein
MLRFVRPTAAVIIPPLVQLLWVELLLHHSSMRAPAAFAVQAYWRWWLSIPACAAMWLFLGCRLIAHDYPDPRLDFALLYFSLGLLLLLAISVVLMINW